MKEVSLKILFSVSSHSRFVLGTPHRLTSLCVACSLTRTDSTLAATLRVSDPSNQSLSLPWLLTDDLCFLFPSPLGSPNTLSQYCVLLAAFVPFPPCLHYALFALRSLCIPHPLWLDISQTRTAILFAGFYRIVLSESYIFLGTVLLFQAPIGTFQSQRFLLKTLLLVFILHNISCVKYI